MLKRLLEALAVLSVGLMAFPESVSGAGPSPESYDLRSERPLTGRQADSLWRVATNLSRHGRFAESNAVFSHLCSNSRLSKRRSAGSLAWMQANAALDGDYKSALMYDTLRFGTVGRGADYEYYRALASVDRDSVSRPDTDVVVDYRLEVIDINPERTSTLIKVPVSIGGSTEEFVLDNGAAMFCFADDSFARSHGIRPLDNVTATASGVTDRVKTWIGVADSLSVGEMTFYNIVFHVLPDDPQLDSIVKIDAILGGSFFRLAGEVDICGPDRKLIFPAHPQECEPNISVTGGGVDMLDVTVFGKEYPFLLDLGAAHTELSSRWYQANKGFLRRGGYCTSTLNMGGVGGIRKVESYMIPSLELKVGGATFIKKEARVNLDSAANQGLEYGSIGNDIVESFSVVRVNLRDMYISFSPL